MGYPSSTFNVSANILFNADQANQKADSRHSSEINIAVIIVSAVGVTASISYTLSNSSTISFAGGAVSKLTTTITTLAHINAGKSS